MFKSRLKYLREELGLNRKKAAELFEIPYTTYVNYESGAREPASPPLTFLRKNITFQWITCWEGPTKEKPKTGF
jgi:DNA-binding XRE family transcriptional regulator